MNTKRSIGVEHLLDRLLLRLRRQSASAESLLHTLCHLARQHEIQLFVVGGLVRDVLLDLEQPAVSALDIDLAIDGDPAPFHAALGQAAHAQPTVHDRFGTASVSLADGTQIDLARTRRERYPSPGALPIVSPAPIAVDLQRRDFTINAAALPLGEDGGSTLVDPHGTIPDLGRRLIRTLHRDSFRDDSTRLIRAARYASRIGGTMAGRTLADARRDRRYLVALSAGRFGDAWRLLLREPDAGHALGIARQLRIPQSRDQRWLIPSSLIYLFGTPEQFWALTGLLGRDDGRADWLPGSVAMNRNEREALEAGSVLRLMRPRLGQLKRPSRVARSLERFPESALVAAAQAWSGRSGEAVSYYLDQRFRARSPISARRLIELGVDRGPRLGEWIREIEAAVWDGQLDPDDPSSVARMEQRIRWSR